MNSSDPFTAQRCSWSESTRLYMDYHDTEWGVPEKDHQALFAKLMLDGFQAGLSWITILNKREAFYEAFEGFNPERIVTFDTEQVESLMGNAKIVRNRAKINACISSARSWLTCMDTEPGGFAALIWNSVDGKPRQNSFHLLEEIPAATPASTALSRELKKRGFRFCGPTIVYAFMQACGLVNDHLIGCFRQKECARLGTRFDVER